MKSFLTLSTVVFFSILSFLTEIKKNLSESNAFVSKFPEPIEKLQKETNSEIIDLGIDKGNQKFLVRTSGCMQVVYLLNDNILLSNSLDKNSNQGHLIHAGLSVYPKCV